MKFLNRRFAASLLVLPVLLLAACGGSSSSSTPGVTVTGLSLSATSAPFLVGAGTQLTATATYSDGTTQDVTGSASYVSSAQSKATVSAAGLVTAVATGTVRITASYSGKTAFKDLTISAVAPTLTSIAITTDPATVGVGATLQLAVTGTYSDSSTHDVTPTSTFVSGTPVVASVTSPGGVVSGLTVGTTTITASNGGKSATKDVSVTAVVPPSADQIVFYDGYGADVTFKNNPDSAVDNNLTIDSTPADLFNGRKVISFPITATTGKFSGGSWVTSTPRVLTSYDAVTFYARSSVAMTLELAGFGDDTTNTPAGTALAAERHGLPVTTAWRKFTLPIPNPAKFTGVNGLFYLADGTADSKGKTLFLADIVYVHLGSALGTPAPAIAAGAQALSVPRYETSLLAKGNNQAIWTVTGDAANPVTLSPVGNAYFDYASTDSTIASVSPVGAITGNLVGGPVNVTATLAGTPATGSYAVTVTFALARPSTLPPTPTVAAGPLVYSLHSSVPGGYNGTVSDQSAKVDTWLTSWSGGTGGAPFAISDGTNTANPRKYVLSAVPNHYVGIEFIGGATLANEIDAVALGLDTLHVDVWSPDLAGEFQIVLTDLGTNTTGVAVFTASSTPAVVTGGWMSFDLKLATAFPALTGRHHLAQLQFVAPTPPPATGGTIYVDNLYFYNSTGGGGGGGGGGGTGPTTVAALPTAAAGNVISLFSSTYTGGTAGGDYSAKVGSYDASCFGGAPGSSTVTDFIIPGTSHVVKQYTVSANSFLSIETIGATGGTTPSGDSAVCNGGTQNGANLIDISTMTGLHLDVWSTKAAVTFNGNVYTAPTLPFNTGAGALSAPIGNQGFAAGTWVPIDITFGDLSQITKMSLLQLFSGEGGTIYVDNIYFYKGSSGGGGGGGGATAPTTAAPTPTVAAANVISLYNSSGTYSNIAVSTWSTGWSGYGPAGGYATYPIPSTASTVHQYGKLQFAGVDFTAVNATAAGLTHFHADVWTPAAVAQFGIKLGLGGGAQAIVPAAVTAGTWTPVDIPLSSFTGVDLTNINEFLFVDNLTSNENGTFFVDNVYFYKGAGGGGGAPSAPNTAPVAPTALATDVISLLSASYTGVAIDTWGTSWSNNGAGPRLTESTIAGAPYKSYAALGFVGIEFIGAGGVNEIDASTMTHFHVDVWTPDITSFQIKLVDFGADMAFGGGDDTDALFVAEAGTTPALTGTGQWVSLDVPLSSFVKSGATWNRNHLAQMLFISGTGSGTAYVANIYFHK